MLFLQQFFFVVELQSFGGFIHCNCLWAEKRVRTIGARGKPLARLQLGLNISGSEQTSSPPLWSERGCDIFRQQQPRRLYYTRCTHTCVCGHTPALSSQQCREMQASHKFSIRYRSSLGGPPGNVCRSGFQNVSKQKLSCKIKSGFAFFVGFFL